MKCRAIVALEITRPDYMSGDDLAQLLEERLPGTWLAYDTINRAGTMIEAVEIHSVAVSS